MGFHQLFLGIEEGSNDCGVCYQFVHVHFHFCCLASQMVLKTTHYAMRAVVIFVCRIEGLTLVDPWSFIVSFVLSHGFETRFIAISALNFISTLIK